MTEQINWRIYYADESTFDSSMGEPWDAPATRVVLIVQRHEDPQERPYFQWMDDYYLWKLGRWYATDYSALLFYWFVDKFPHRRACLAGETVSNKTWLHIGKIAKADKDFFG